VTKGDSALVIKHKTVACIQECKVGYITEYSYKSLLRMR